MKKSLSVLIAERRDRELRRIMAAIEAAHREYQVPSADRGRP